MFWQKIKISAFATLAAAMVSVGVATITSRPNVRSPSATTAPAIVMAGPSSRVSELSHAPDDEANAALLRSLIMENKRSLDRITVARYRVSIDAFDSSLKRQYPQATASLLKNGERSWSEFSFLTVEFKTKEEMHLTIRAFQNVKGAGVWPVNTATASYAEKNGGVLPKEFEALKAAEPQDIRMAAFGDGRQLLQSAIDNWSSVKGVKIVAERGSEGRFTIIVFSPRRKDGPSVLFTLDSTRGFLVTAVDAFYANGRLASSIRTTATAIGSERIWFPERYERTSFDDSEKTAVKTKTTIVASNVELNGPVRDEEFDFSTLKIPDETKVDYLKADGTKLSMMVLMGEMIDQDAFYFIKFAERDRAAEAAKATSGELDVNQ